MIFKKPHCGYSVNKSTSREYHFEVSDMAFRVGQPIVWLLVHWGAVDRNHQTKKIEEFGDLYNIVSLFFCLTGVSYRLSRVVKLFSSREIVKFGHNQKWQSVASGVLVSGESLFSATKTSTTG